ncbi:MAG: TatD family hydrolase [Chitinophagaceae bacterium]|nr:TatD family hydrolase [Chitinophagaceae bacterium]
MLIDTHAHIYAEEFINDIDDIILRAKAEGIQKIFLPAIDSNSLQAMLNLENKYADICMAMIGLHPCYVKDNYMHELSIVRNYLEKRKFAAIGEIGLDFYWDKTFAQEQHAAFVMQIEWALQYHLPIVIHTRNAMQETINIVKGYVPKGIRGIFHCFSGSYESAKEIIKAGFYLGIGGVLTYKNSGLADVLDRIDLQHIVVETDAPYLTPLPFRGKRNESSYLKYIVEKIALIKNIPIKEVEEITTANAIKAFSC